MYFVQKKRKKERKNKEGKGTKKKKEKVEERSYFFVILIAVLTSLFSWFNELQALSNRVPANCHTYEGSRALKRRLAVFRSSWLPRYIEEVSEDWPLRDVLLAPSQDRYSVLERTGRHAILVNTKFIALEKA